MLVSANRLSKAYGLSWALRDVSFELQPGACVALLGPNGAGKTTLLRLLSSLTYPSSGTIEIDGGRLHRGSSRLRSSIGYLSPNEHLYENLTCRENLRFFNCLYGKKTADRELEATLDRVGLASRTDHFVSALSAGMKCRLGLAKWMLLKPELLLLDEPYAVLDTSGVELLEDYVTGVRRENGTVVMATHHTPRALAVCSRALILRHGRLIFDEARQGSWENLQRVAGEFFPRAERCAF